MVILNLQATKLDKKADLVIHSYTDSIFEKLIKRLGFEEVPEYDPTEDPTRKTELMTWNIAPDEVTKYEHLCKKIKNLKKHKADDKDDKKDVINKKIKDE